MSLRQKDPFSLGDEVCSLKVSAKVTWNNTPRVHVGDLCHLVESPQIQLGSQRAQGTMVGMGNAGSSTRSDSCSSKAVMWEFPPPPKKRWRIRMVSNKPHVSIHRLWGSSRPAPPGLAVGTQAVLPGSMGQCHERWACIYVSSKILWVPWKPARLALLVFAYWRSKDRETLLPLMRSPNTCKNIPKSGTQEFKSPVGQEPPCTRSLLISRMHSRKLILGAAAGGKGSQCNMGCTCSTQQLNHQAKCPPQLTSYCFLLPALMLKTHFLSIFA